MNVKRLYYAEYSRLFNERCFNPPGERNEQNEQSFRAEFHNALDAVEAFCTAEFPSIPKDEDYAFSVWPSYNWSRVISVELTTHAFLNEAFVSRLQSVLRTLPEAWTVILSHTNTLFVSPDNVLAHLIDLELGKRVDARWIESAPGP